MPIVHIHLTDTWSATQARGISDAVHDTLVDAFKIPEHDYIHRVHRCDKDEFVLAPSKSDKYVVVEMTVFPGRSPEAKAKLYKGIQNRLAAFGVGSNDLLIALHELPLENWGLRGARGDQVTLGFETKV